MAHDCFEDADVAAEMNRLFVNIKVDREERPDLDQIYQAAHQLLTQRGGGWPLTVFLAPDLTPFFAGTSFPQTPRYARPRPRPRASCSPCCGKPSAATHGRARWRCSR